MNIKELVSKAHSNAVKKGFWEDWKMYDESEVSIDNVDQIKYEFINAVGNRLMLIVGEVAEAQEGLRKDDYDNFREELADIVIRVADLAGGLDIDLEQEIIKKMNKNKNRPYKHGKTF